MDFKYFYIALCLLAVSCQDINEQNPGPIKIVNATTKPIPPYDTVYYSPACNTFYDFEMDGNTVFTGSNVVKFDVSPDCLSYRSNGSDTNNHCKIYMHKQSIASKRMKIIPYKSDIDIKSYSETMILIHFATGETYLSVSGNLFFKSKATLGFCSAVFENKATKVKKIISFSF